MGFRCEETVDILAGLLEVKLSVCQVVFQVFNGYVDEFSTGALNLGYGRVDDLIDSLRVLVRVRAEQVTDDADSGGSSFRPRELFESGKEPQHGD